MTMASLLRALKRSIGLGRKQLSVSPRHVVLITGCDSGLGHSLAVYCHNALNMTVISCCHNINSEGANLLRQLNEEQKAAARMHTLELDLLQPSSIKKLHAAVLELLATDDSYVFLALVNNAGVMCFGEFEWQTSAQLELQVNCNILGTMRLTMQFMPIVRQQRARIINITSHCGIQALPALAPYAATKAAIRYWNDALRIELAQYGIEVVNFVPGSFVLASNIAARQQDHALEMHASFTDEQRLFYGVYFEQFNAYLRVLSGFKAPDKFQDDALLSKFHDALTNTQPAALYIHEPWKYKLYRWLFRISPTPLVDWLAVKFCAMPTYQSVNMANGKQT